MRRSHDSNDNGLDISSVLPHIFRRHNLVIPGDCSVGRCSFDDIEASWRFYPQLFLPYALWTDGGSYRILYICASAAAFVNAMTFSVLAPFLPDYLSSRFGSSSTQVRFGLSAYGKSGLSSRRYDENTSKPLRWAPQCIGGQMGIFLKASG